MSSKILAGFSAELITERLQNMGPQSHSRLIAKMASILHHCLYPHPLLCNLSNEEGPDPSPHTGEPGFTMNAHAEEFHVCDGPVTGLGFLFFSFLSGIFIFSLWIIKSCSTFVLGHITYLLSSYVIESGGSISEPNGDMKVWDLSICRDRMGFGLSSLRKG